MGRSRRDRHRRIPEARKSGVPGQKGARRNRVDQSNRGGKSTVCAGAVLFPGRQGVAEMYRCDVEVVREDGLVVIDIDAYRTRSPQPH